MKYLGSSMLAALLIFPACADENKKQDSVKKQSAVKTEVAGERKAGKAEADKTEADKARADKAEAAAVKDDKTPLSEEDAVKFYKMLTEATSGQDGIKGVCGDTKQLAQKQNQKYIGVHLPYKNCEIDGAVINGKLHLDGKRGRNKLATIIGDVRVTGTLTGLCAINLNYPDKSLFDILATTTEENVADQSIEFADLKGKFCNFDVEDVAKKAEKLRQDDIAEAKAEAAKAEATPDTTKADAVEPEGEKAPEAPESAKKP